MSEERPAHLPDFGRPPIDEVVLGVHFPPIEGYSDVVAWQVWQRLRHSYPSVQVRPPTEMIIEDLSTPRSGVPQELGKPTVEIVGPSDPITNRTWLVSADDSTLLQLQNTMFLRNWRRREGDYGHLEEHVDAFWVAYEVLREVLTQEGLPHPAVKQLELSYFNWIPTPRPLEFFVPAQDLQLRRAGLVPVPEDLVLRSSLLDVKDGTPVGRLRLDCIPAFRVEPDNGAGTHGFRLMLSYRARVDGFDDDGLRQAIARGREVIDLSFVEVTTEEARKRWEQYDELDRG